MSKPKIPEGPEIPEGIMPEAEWRAAWEHANKLFAQGDTENALQQARALTDKYEVWVRAWRLLNPHFSSRLRLDLGITPPSKLLTLSFADWILNNYARKIKDDRVL